MALSSAQVIRFQQRFEIEKLGQKSHSFNRRLCSDEHQVQCKWIPLRGAGGGLCPGHHPQHLPPGAPSSDGHQVHVPGRWMRLLRLRHPQAPPSHPGGPVPGSKLSKKTFSKENLKNEKNMFASHLTVPDASEHL